MLVLELHVIARTHSIFQIMQHLIPHAYKIRGQYCQHLLHLVLQKPLSLPQWETALLFTPEDLLESTKESQDSSSLFSL